MYREFLVPEDEEVYEALGERPDSTEDGVRTLTLRDASGRTLVFSYDVLSRSVRIRWTNEHGTELLDVFREGATRLSVTGGGSGPGVSVDFHMGECAGATDIRVTPTLTVMDRLLFQ
jgi:YD repeat-containing protein